MKNLRQNNGVISRAAAKAGIHRQTAAAYLKAGMGPEERKANAPPRTRRRPDPLAGGLWETALTWLVPTPEIDAKALFEHLLARHPEWATTAGRSLRTFQRRIKQWRELHGPPKEVYFPQDRKPCESLQFDWTRVKPKDFAVTIAGEPFEHLLAHAVLPYSNWEWAVPCVSESALSLKRGVQEALWQLGGVPPVLQTDQSSTATHQIERGSSARTFNLEYLAFCRHLKVEPRTIHVASPDENGDVECAQGHLKRRIRNHLILRGSSDFATEAEYTAFVAKVCHGANALRTGRLSEELPLLRALPARRYPETQELTALVTGASTINVNKIPYSVPSRLIGVKVSVQVGEREIRIFHGGTLILKRPKAQEQAPGIDYRHVIGSLLKKPGAFRKYVHRESLFPDICFRQAYEALKAHDEPRADKRYLQLLKLAAEGSETAVSEAIGVCLRTETVPLPERIEKALTRAARRALPAARRISPLQPSLQRYDALLAALVRS